MTIRISFIAILVCVALLAAELAYAHGDGASFEAQVGEYFMDIGYEPEVPVAGETLLLDLNLWREQNVSRADFDSAWVRLSQDGKTVLATGVAKPDLGPMTVLVQLPEDAGDLSLDVRFEKRGLEDWVVAEKTFTFSSESQKSSPLTSENFIQIALGFALGALVAFLGMRARTRLS